MVDLRAHAFDILELAVGEAHSVLADAVLGDAGARTGDDLRAGSRVRPREVLAKLSSERDSGRRVR
jgi:hypothetical protein